MNVLQSEQLTDGLEEHPLAFLDSLSYIDPYDETDQMNAIALIEEELMKNEPRQLSEVMDFDSNILQEEWNKITEDGNYILDAIDLERYKVSKPTTKRLKEWEKCVQDSKIQYENLQIRLENLELSDAYGENAWIKHNEYLVNLKKSMEESLKKTKKEINAVNIKRKKEQENAHKKILLAEEYLPPQ